jgi:hypothetical protein
MINVDAATFINPKVTVNHESLNGTGSGTLTS